MEVQCETESGTWRTDPILGWHAKANFWEATSFHMEGEAVQGRGVRDYNQTPAILGGGRALSSIIKRLPIVIN